MLIFVLAFFLDFFELSFIIIPLVGPVADKLGIDLIWFGVLLGVNMQTSFMHPPFGFALFYLRSVAPAKDYVDRLSKKLTKGVTTGQIYWGAVPFVIIQVIMIAMVITFPQMVMVYKAGEKKYDINKIQIIVPEEQPLTPGAPDAKGAPPPSGGEEQDAAEKALERAFGNGAPEASPQGDAPKAPAGQGAESAPGASEQEDAAKALERAMGAPAPDTNQKAPEGQAAPEK